MPPLFARNNTVLTENGKRIIKSKCSRFEREAVVLPLVDPVLFIVPLKPHRYTKCITHRGEWTCGLVSSTYGDSAGKGLGPESRPTRKLARYPANQSTLLCRVVETPRA